MSIKVKSDKIIDWYGYARQLVPFLIRRPLGWFFYLTGRCNLNCNYCWQRKKPLIKSEGGKDSQNELTGEQWIKIIKTLPKLSFVGLTGGEPLLHPDFKNIVNYLGGRFPFTINTNGSLLSEELIDILVRNKASNISISLDGFADVHDVSRNKSGLFNNIVERIKCLNSAKKKRDTNKPSLTIKTVLLDPLLDRLEEFYRFCSEILKADCLNISLMIITEHTQQGFCFYENLNDLMKIGEPRCYPYEKKDRIPEALAYILEYSKTRRCEVLLYPRMYRRSSIKYLVDSDGKNVFAPCYVPWSYIVISSEGIIIPCLPLKLGNICELNYDVGKIQKLIKYQNFLKWRSVMNRAEKSPPECNMCCFSTVKVK